MALSLTRQQFLAAGLAAIPARSYAQASTPLLLRYTAATIGAADIEGLAALYNQMFGYEIAERGTIDPALAISWGTPRMSGRRFINLRQATGENVFVRAVAIDPMPGFKAATTLGWNSIELVSDNPDKIGEKLKGSPIAILGQPAQLKGFPSIRAMQTLGPAQEVIHITSETGDQKTSPLPPPPKGGGVGRIFIIVLAVSDVARTNDWYAATFNMSKNPLRHDPISIVNGAQNLPADHAADATYIRMAEQGNPLEFWGFDGAAAVPRPRGFEQLPPGVAMATLAVKDLDAIKGVAWLRPPAKRDGLVYGGRRAATFFGPSGELVELVEEK